MSLLDAQEHAASVLTSHEAVKDLVAAAFDDYDLVDQPAPHFHAPPPERIPALVHPHSEVCFLLSLTCSCLLAPCPHVCPPPNTPRTPLQTRDLPGSPARSVTAVASLVALSGRFRPASSSTSSHCPGIEVLEGQTNFRRLQNGTKRPIPIDLYE